MDPPGLEPVARWDVGFSGGGLAYYSRTPMPLSLISNIEVQWILVCAFILENHHPNSRAMIIFHFAHVLCPTLYFLLPLPFRGNSELLTVCEGSEVSEPPGLMFQLPPSPSGDASTTMT